MEKKSIDGNIPSSINDERKKGTIFRHFFFGSAYLAKK